MAHFEKVDFPGMPTFHITDDYGHISELTAEQAYELYAWLHTYADEMWQAIHPRAVKALEAVQPPTERQDDLTMEKLMLEFMRTPGQAYHPAAKEHTYHLNDASFDDDGSSFTKESQEPPKHVLSVEQVEDMIEEEYEREYRDAEERG